MKLGIVVDSSCGFNKEETNQRGWNFIPLIVTIDGKDYEDGINLKSEDYYRIININNDVKTAATPLGKAHEVFEKASKEYDYVLVYPLSFQLSSQFNNLTKIAKEFKNIFVVKSEGVGTSIISDCEILEKMAKENASWEKIKQHSIELTQAQFGLSAIKNMQWLVKGGRVSGATASMARLMKIIPIIEIKHGKLEKFDKGRIFEKTVIKIAKYMRDNYQEKNKNYQFSIYHTGGLEIDQIVASIKELLPITRVSYFPPVIGNHLGPEAVSLLAHLKS